MAAEASAGRGPIKVAGIQISPSESIEQNLDKATRFIDHAVTSGAGMVCFPQLFFLPWFLEEETAEARAHAIPADHEIMRRFSDAARKHEAVLVCPFYEESEGKAYSAAAVYDADGSLAGIYRKVHIPDIPGWREKHYFAPGDRGLPVFDTARGRLGVQLCWDNFFPEGSRALALAGAEIILAPTAAAYASQERWFHVISANAFVNNIFVFRVNRVGHDHGLDFYGHSFCVDPYGELIAEPVGLQESILMAEVDLACVAEAREQSGFFRDRREQLYHEPLPTRGEDAS
jgi:N-carbamoylputrescine amidase